MVRNVRPVTLAREIAATHYTECRANKKLFEHRVRNDVRLVGVSTIIVELITKIAISLFVFWITRNYTEVSPVLAQEEITHLELEGLVEDE